jgi:hypothetical protein
VSAETDIDALYKLPLDEFTAARNALAKRLSKESDPEAAEAVRKLAKPTVPAWAVNQLVRREPKLVAGLIESGEALQDQLVAGRGAEALRAAQQRERQALRELVRAAEALLKAAGRSATAQTLERISETLAAGSKSADGRAALQSGRLSAELEPAGFEALLGMTPAPSARKASARDELAEKRRAKQELERERRRLKEELRKLERQAAAAERDAEEARKAAEEARAAADEAARTLAELD